MFGKRALASATLAVVAVACSRSDAPESHAAVTTPQREVVYIVATPTAVALVGSFTLVPTAVPAMQSFSFSQDLPAIRPTPTAVDVSSIPNMDRPREPPPKTLTDQMRRCLTYTVMARGPVITHGRSGMQLEVRVSNSCGVSFAAGDSWFEVRARNSTGVIGREVGRFQEAIMPGATAVTFIQIDDCPRGCSDATYEASTWWAAGGGRKVGE